MTPPECWCDEPARGQVAADAVAPAHDCRECSAEHCNLVVTLRRCEFGICTREAEIELTLSESLDPVKVCGLHVAPVLGWGVPEPIAPAVRYLSQRTLPDRAA